MSEHPCGDEVSSLVQSVRDHAATTRKLAVVEAERDAALAQLADLRRAIEDMARMGESDPRGNTRDVAARLRTLLSDPKGGV